MIDIELLYKAFHISPDAILISRLEDGRLIEVNDGFSRLSGFSREESLAHTSMELGLWIDIKDREKVVGALQKDHRIQGYKLDFRSKAGRTLNCLVSGEVIKLGNQEAYVLWIVREVADRKAQQDLLSATLGVLPIGVCVTDQEGTYRMVNDAYCGMYEFDRDEIIGRHYSMVLPADEVAISKARYTQLLNGNIGSPNERKHLRKDGSNMYIEVTHALVEDVGNQKMVITTVRDITKHKQVDKTMQMRLKLWEYAASQSLRELMQKALDEIEDLTGSLVSFYHFVDADQSALSLQAWSTRTEREFCKAEGAGMHYPIEEAGVWVDCVYERKPVIHNDYESLSHRKGMPEGHARLIRELVVPTMRDGKVVSILGIGNKPIDYDQQDIELVAYIADLVWEIVEQKRVDEQIRQLNTQLEHLAMTDELTGLANRRAFFMQGTSEIKRVRRYRTPLSLLMLDLDGFKAINDRFGHEVGDMVLQRVAETLTQNVREIDTVARMGGEEFSVLLPNTKSGDAVTLAERLRLAIEKICHTVQDQQVRVTVSIGVSTYQKEISGIDAMLRNADAAMYQAKNEGRNRVVLSS